MSPLKVSGISVSLNTNGHNVGQHPTEPTKMAGISMSQSANWCGIAPSRSSLKMSGISMSLYANGVTLSST